MSSTDDSVLDTTVIPISELVGDAAIPAGPLALLQDTLGNLTEGFSFLDYTITYRDDGFELAVELLLPLGFTVPLPGLDGMALVLLDDGSNPPRGCGTDIQGYQARIVVTGETFLLRIENLSLALRFPDWMLSPADPAASAYSQVELFAALEIDQNGDIRFELDSTVTLTPSKIGNTGITLAAAGVKLDLSRTTTLPEVLAAGYDESFRGVYIADAQLTFPESLAGILQSLAVKDFIIGSGGVSGKILSTFSGASQDLLGVPFSLDSISITLKRNVLVEFRVSGTMTVPFFQKPMGVDLTIDDNGTIALQLTGNNAVLTKAGVLQLTVRSVILEVSKGVFTLHFSGQIKPLAAGVDWPSFDVDDLSVDSQGNIHVRDGWIQPAKPLALDFHGFHVEVSKIGLGKLSSGRKWLGLSGSMKLVDGFQAAASVDGLRISWDDDPSNPNVSVTVEGVGVEFEVPDVLQFKGSVRYRELPGGGDRFDGSVRVHLTALNLQIDGILVIGRTAGVNFFGIYLDAELPAGIPLGPLPVSLYGFAGLLAIQLAPNKKADEAWYAAQASSAKAWITPTDKVADIDKKWEPRAGALALGAGVTIGTTDNGFTFAGKLLLVVVLPGPLMLLDGRANLMKERAKLAGSEVPLFRALAILDARPDRESLLVALDAAYKYDESGGDLIDIRGGAEAYFSFKDSSDWHIYLGVRDPREQRIRAQILHLFEANAYFMLDGRRLATGAWVGYEKRFQFGPASLEMAAWIDCNAAISWKQAYLAADAWLHGAVRVRVFRFGIALSVDALFAIGVFEPFSVRAELRVALELPWPLKDIEVDLTLEWTRPTRSAPQLPLPVREAAVEHLKSSATWPLSRGGLLLPNYDAGGGFLPSSLAQGQENAPPPANTPVVPLDARPSLTFARPVHDDTLVGVNPQPPNPEYEQIGDPDSRRGPVQVRYGLAAVRLDAWQAPSWRRIGSSVTGEQTGGVRPIFGSWAPIVGKPITAQDPPGANSKLLLWSTSGYDHVRLADGGWVKNLPGVMRDPCVVVPQIDARSICVDFAGAPRGTVSSPYRWPAQAAFELSWDKGLTLAVTGEDPRSLCFGNGRSLATFSVRLTDPAQEIEIDGTGGESREVVDFSQRRILQPVPLPSRYVDSGFTFEELTGAPLSLDPPLPNTPNRWAGLRVDLAVRITLPFVANCNLTITVYGPAGVVAQGFDEHGAPCGAAVDFPPAPSTPTTSARDVPGGAVSSVVVRNQSIPSLNAQPTKVFILDVVATQAPATAVGVLRSGGKTAPVTMQSGVIKLTGDDLVGADVSTVGVCVQRICARFGPTAVRSAEIRNMAGALQNSVARWSEAGETLQPDTTYRLAVTTTVDPTDRPKITVSEYGYFKTEGPPGLVTLSVPESHPDPLEFKANNGLQDLVRYVRQTTPATVPASGQPPRLPTSFYRAFDIGVEFNENYVDFMYRLAQRDLGLYLYDANNRPVSDAEGRLVMLSNAWGKTPKAVLSETETAWIAAIGKCGAGAAVDQSAIQRDTTLEAASSSQVLDPSTLYEARLIPLLLHEDFRDFLPGQTFLGPAASAGGWTVAQTGVAGQCKWEIKTVGSARFAAQTAVLAALAGGPVDPPRAGAFLIRASAAWSDVRFSAFTSSLQDATGLVFRYSSAGDHYSFVLDRKTGRRSLFRLAGGVATILKQDTFAFDPGKEYLQTVEAVGNLLNAYQDGALVFAVQDPALTQGTIGLYASAHAEAHFSDIRVDDFSKSAAVVYRFAFSTSRFANFEHHMQSFSGRARTVVAPIGLDLAGGGAPGTVVGEAENRAFLAVEATLFGPSPRRLPASGVEVTRLDSGGRTVALLVESPEPVEWDRLSLMASTSQQSLIPQDAAGAVKIVDATLDPSAANADSATLLAMETVDLAGYAIEARGFPAPLAAQPPVSEAGWTFTDGSSQPPAGWAAQGQTVTRTAQATAAFAIASALPPAYDQSIVAQTNALPNQVGVVLRYTDPRNHYRVVLSNAAPWPSVNVLKRVAGTETVLVSLPVALDAAHVYIVQASMVGTMLRVTLDGAPCCAIADRALASGSVGLYCGAGTAASFSNVVFPLPPAEPPGLLLLQESFESAVPGRWTFADAATVPNTPQWKLGGGRLLHDRLGAPSATPGGVARYALAGDAEWSDYRVTARVGTDDGYPVGVVFRYRDPANCYRFSLDAHTPQSGQLRRIVDGVETVLWQGGDHVLVGNDYFLTVDCLGPSLTIFVNGVRAASVTDPVFATGRAGIYVSSFARAYCSAFEVIGGPWRPYHRFGPMPKLAAGEHVRVASTVPTGGTDVKRQGPALDRRGPYWSSLVDLRMVAPDGQPGHLRRFSLGSPDQPRQASLLRKGDGSAFFVVFDAVQPIAARWPIALEFRFRRAVDGKILSQAGDQSDEVTVIEVS